MIERKCKFKVFVGKENRFEIVADEEDKIKTYADSGMIRFYLPNTLLMSKYLSNP